MDSQVYWTDRRGLEICVAVMEFHGPVGDGLRAWDNDVRSWWRSRGFIAEQAGCFEARWLHFGEADERSEFGWVGARVIVRVHRL